MLGSFKGPRLRIFAAVIAVIALAAGIWVTFFRTAGYQKTTATIVSIETDPDYVPDPNVTMCPIRTSPETPNASSR